MDNVSVQDHSVRARELRPGDTVVIPAPSSGAETGALLLLTRVRRVADTWVHNGRVVSLDIVTLGGISNGAERLLEASSDSEFTLFCGAVKP